MNRRIYRHVTNPATTTTRKPALAKATSGYYDNRHSEETLDAIANYRSRLAGEHWPAIAETVRAGVIASNPSTTATTRANLAVVTKYVLWVYRTTGYPLDDPSEVFLHHLIRRYVKSEFRDDKSQYRQQTVYRLKVIARNLGDDDPNQEAIWPAPPKGLYTEADKTAFASSARARGTARTRGNMQIVVALGFGAGLRGDEIALAKVEDIEIADKGNTAQVRIHGKHSRLVPIHARWIPTLQAGLQGRTDGYALRGYRYEKTPTWIITWHHVAAPEEPHPSPQRMRSTWIVEHYDEGLDMDVLHKISGYKLIGELRKHIRKFRPNAYVYNVKKALGGVL